MGCGGAQEKGYGRMCDGVFLEIYRRENIVERWGGGGHAPLVLIFPVGGSTEPDGVAADDDEVVDMGEVCSTNC